MQRAARAPRYGGSFVAAVVVLAAACGSSVPAAAAEDDPSRRVLLAEDWETGAVDASRWTLFGDPQPEVVAFGGRANVLDNKGDRRYDSGVLSAAPLDVPYGSEFRIEAEAYLDFSNRDGCYVAVRLGMALEADVAKADLASREPRTGVSLTLHGDGADCRTPEEHQRKAWFSGGFYTADGRLVALPAYTLSAEHYVGGWHRLAVVVDAANLVSFHVDDTLLWESDEPMDPAYRSGRLLVGGRSSGSAGKAYVDDVSVSATGIGPAGPPPTTQADHTVAYMPRALDPVRQGFVRVVNHGAVAGEVRIDAYDDAGSRRGPLTLALPAFGAAHFNSDDLENGNPAKGLAGAAGVGTGDWRLELRTALDAEVLSYVRTADGFVTTMHNAAPAVDDVHRVAFFNPAANVNQESLLRLVNAGTADVAVELSARDDAGQTELTSLTVPAGTSRTYSARELESGTPELSRGIGAGTGKRFLVLEASGPLTAASLLSSPTGHLTNLSTVPTPVAGVHTVPLFPSRSAAGRQGFVRVVNNGPVAGEARIDAYDDDGNHRGPLMLAVPPFGGLHFNSDDLEGGNAAKGLAGSTGAGVGDWRLELRSALGIEVLSYVRTEDGFLTSMHDLAPAFGNSWRLPFLNPGRNAEQVSSLRLVNPGVEDATATVRGIDDAGVQSGEVVLTVPARGARTYTSRQLESGSGGVAGALGSGVGKWRLEVDATTRLLAMSLLESPTGHLTNLSSVPALGPGVALPPGRSAEALYGLLAGPVVQAKCVACHVAGGEAGETRLVFVAAGVPDHQAANLQALRDYIADPDGGGVRLLAKMRGDDDHGGGEQVAANSPEYADMERLVSLLAGESGAPGPVVALAGPLSGARVVVRELADATRIVQERTTDANGRLHVPADTLRDDLLYLVEAAGGRDQDGASNGRLRALLTRDQLLSDATIVSVLTDIAWRYTMVKPGESGVADNLVRLNDIARVLIREDLDGDGVVGHRDLAAFDPQSDGAALAFDYDDLADRNRFDDFVSVLDVYRGVLDADAERLLTAKLHAIFAGRLSAFAPPDSRATSVTVTLVPFGNGEVRSADGRFDFHSDAEATSAGLVRVYPRGSATLLFEATPRLGSRVLAWNGCDGTANDLSSCTVSLHRDRTVEVMFGYESATVVDGFTDLTAAWTRMAANGTLTVATGSDTLAETIRGLAGRMIVSAASGPRRVDRVNETGTRRFELATSPASLDDIILEGTLQVTKGLSEGDLVETVGDEAVAPPPLPGLSGAGAVRSAPRATFTSDYEGVSLVRSGDPSSDRFVIEVGAGAVQAAAAQAADTNCGPGGEGCTVTIRDADGNEARLRGEVVVTAPTIEFAASWGQSRGLEYVKAVPRMGMIQMLDVAVDEDFSVADTSTRLATFTLAPVTARVGAVPVVLTPTFEIHIGIEGTAEADVAAAFELRHRLRAGFVYRKNVGTQRIWDFDRRWAFTAPESNFEGEVRPYVEATAPLTIYGTAGPSVLLKGYVRLTGMVGREPIGSPGCRVNNGTDAALGLHTGVVWAGGDEAGSILGDFTDANVAVPDLSGTVLEVPVHDFDAGGFCEPHLAVAGSNIHARGHVVDGAVSVRGEYTVSNAGTGSLPWSIRLDAGCPLSATASGDNGVLHTGTVDAGGSTDVEIVFAGELEIGEHRCTLAFGNDHHADRAAGDRPPDARTGTTERAVSVSMIWPPSAPHTVGSAISDDGERIVLTWSHGACASASTRRRTHHNNVHGFQIARTISPDDADSWENAYFHPAFAGAALSRTCRFEIPLRSPDIAWERDTRYYFRVFAAGEERSEHGSTNVRVPPANDGVPSFATSLADLALRVGQAITPLTLPEATGDAPLSYSLRPVPAGMRFDPATRVLSGTPAAAAGTEYAMVYTATDADGDAATLSFGIRLVAAQAGDTKQPGETFRDQFTSGGEGPQMVVLPAGSFRMGCLSDDIDCSRDELPVHDVTVAGFALSTHEVTFAEWDACRDAGGCRRRPNDQGWGRGERPVIYVSWNDANEYARWLSAETGAHYRLPSEAEWEYAARAGTQTKYHWGDEIGTNLAVCERCGSQWDEESTAPVGSFDPNAWGLYDMHGNVEEWIEDCWHDNYDDAPGDGSAWITGSCDGRVFRSGAFNRDRATLRAASRAWLNASVRAETHGFRVARTLAP